MYNVLSSLAACGRAWAVAARPACLFGKRPVARDSSTHRTLARRQQTESVVCQ